MTRPDQGVAAWWTTGPVWTHLHLPVEVRLVFVHIDVVERILPEPGVDGESVLVRPFSDRRQRNGLVEEATRVSTSASGPSEPPAIITLVQFIVIISAHTSHMTMVHNRVIGGEY